MKQQQETKKPTKGVAEMNGANAPSPGNKPKQWGEMKFGEKYTYIMSHITVEPMMACYIMPCVFASLATQNLSIEKACRVNLAYSDEICNALSARQTANYTHEEAQVQQLVASMTVWKTILQSALPAFLILFVGAWSDRWGLRKPCMLLPIVGEFITVIGLMFCTYFFYELPMEVNAFIEGLFPAITGGWFTMFMGIFSYIADVTTVEMRTLRIGVVNVFCSLGIPVGLALSGILFKKIGFYGVFSISAVMYVISFWYGYYKIVETKKVDVPTVDFNGNPCAFLKDFFDLKHVSETFRVAFKSGQNNRKMKVMLLMLVVMVVIGPMHGEMVVMYLFTRFKYNWDELDFSIYSTYNMITSLIGTTISVGLFSHFLKMDDALIGVISSTSKVLSSLVYAFAKTTTQFYMGALVEIFNGTSFIAMRSIASKLVPTEELGKVNSLFGVCEALMPLLYGPMYSATYAATMETLPGAFLLLGGGLTIPAVIIFMWMYFQHRKDARRPTTLSAIDAEESIQTKDQKKSNGLPDGRISIISNVIENDVSHKDKECVGHENAAFEEEKQKL